MSADTTHEERRFKVKDVENYHQKERLRSLHEARQQFFQVRRRITELELENQIGAFDANKAMRDTVEELIYQCEQLMKRDDIAESIGRSYWDNCWLGEITVPENAWLPDDVNPKFNGLRSIVEAPDPIPVYYQSEVAEIGHPSSTETNVQYIQIPRKPILEKAFRKAEEFLEQVNLGIQLSEQEQTWGFFEVDEEEGDEANS